VLTDPSPEVRTIAVIALGQIGDPAGAPAVRTEASSRLAVDQAIAIRILGKLRDRESVPLLTERLRSTSGEVRIAAADALGEIGDWSATLPLIEALNDPWARRAAAVALARLGDPRAEEPVRLAHRASTGLARRRIGKALVRIESGSDSQGQCGDSGKPGGAGRLPWIEYQVMVPVLMAMVAWNAIKVKSKKQRRAETIEQAERLFRAQSKDPELTQEAFEFAERAVGEFPDDPKIRLNYASLLLAFRPVDVGEEVAKAVELGFDDPGSLVRAASLLSFARRWDDVRSCVARANELAEPGFVLKAGLDNLNGILAAKDNEFDRAEKLFRSATAEDQSNAIDLAKFLAWRGRDTEALAVIDEALKHVEYKFSLERLKDDIAEGRFMVPKSSRGELE
jgi:HEAT repeat protein